MRKYLDVFVLSMRNQLIYLPVFLIRNIFFVMIIFIFQTLWRVIYGTADLIAGLTMTQTLWYLTFTETIEFGKDRIFTEIASEIKDGSVAYTLNRPYSYSIYYLARAMGTNVVRTVPMLIIGFATASLFAGILPGYFPAILPGIVVISGGFVLTTLFQIIIGLLAFWFEEVNPFYWIIQKLVFIIGGMFFPIDFFPVWMQGFSKVLPFAFFNYWPAITIVDFSPDKLFITLGGQLVYGLLLAGIIALIYRRAVKKIQVQGG